ncbi:MAG TPA: acyltransferase [Frankiaceae bacterium]|nr:acyltransferase [Frankiaceae bacterium]
MSGLRHKVGILRGEGREYLRQVRRLRAEDETSLRSFVAGLRYPLVHGQSIWVGSRTVLDGRERIEVAGGGSLRVGMGDFGLTSHNDASLIRVRPNARFRCEGVVSLQRGVRIVVDAGELVIGHGTNLNGLSKVLVAQSVRIGADCTLSWDCQILDHDFHAITVDGVERPSAAPVVLGDRVWVGTGALILKGVTIGSDAVVAAGAVVTRDVEPHTVVGGSPARVLGRVDSWR